MDLTEGRPDLNVSTVPDFSLCRLLVLGDVMLDRYWTGSTSRISPEAPVPVVRIETQEDRVGGAGNVAMNIAALGGQVHLVGLIGDDSNGDQLEALLRRSEIHCDLKRVPAGRTITKLRLLARHQQLLRADFEDDRLQDLQGLMGQTLASAVNAVDVVVLSDYAKGALADAPRLVELARSAGKPVVVDPKGNDFSRYRGATLLTPNMSEFEAVAGPCADDAQIAAQASRLCAELGITAILVTRSEKGMTLVVGGSPAVHIPTRAQEVFDVTGAGDTVVATLAVSLAAGLDLAQSAALANIAAGVAVAKLGTATVSPAELRQAMFRASTLTTRGMVEEGELLALVGAARAKGERIVMTNGSFDILHPGHIDYLERARALGDRLIVAVNDDASVSRYKGPQRPINPLASRMRMLAALACVDWVVAFSEDTPAKLVGTVLPDILVKGGDYANQRIAGADEVESAGGSVAILGYLPGHSTTALIDRIRQADR